MAQLEVQPITPVRPSPADGVLIRDPAHEKHLVQTAALSVGMASRTTSGIRLHPNIAALDSLGSQRAWPGPVRLHDRDLVWDAIEEAADARNYLVWHIQRHLDGALRGESPHASEYERGMRGLAAVAMLADALYHRPE